MANVLEYAKIFQNSLDKQIVVESTTGWMELNDKLIKYNGGDEAKIPNMVMDGLADYDRNKGFVDGSVTLKWDTYKLTQDRGRTFSLDSMDVDETNFVATAATIMGEFQRTQVIPEIDAYRYSKLAAIAKEAGTVAATAFADGDTLLAAILADIAKIEDATGISNGFVITMGAATANLLATAKNASKVLGTVNLQKGEIYQRVESLNDNAIVRAPQARLQTAFEFLTGATGQEAGGFKPAADAKAINYIIAPRTAPIAVAKQDKMRIFTPDVNQLKDAWKMDYRKYHELWVPKSKEKMVIVNTVA